MSSCPFCSATSDLTNEHIIPKWLLRELGIVSSHLVAAHLFFGLENSVRRQTFNGFVYGAVCGNCNNNWMSQLENGVKPLLIPMLRPDAGVVGASMSMALNAKLLSIWILKTAGMLNVASNYRKIIPPAHISGLKAGALPAHTFFSAGFCNSSMTTWRQSQQIFCSSSPNHPSPTTMYKVSFQFGSLLLQVAHLDTAWREPDSFKSIWLWPEFRVTKTGHIFESIDDFDIEGGYETP